jgi:hypothetical protein
MPRRMAVLVLEKEIHSALNSWGHFELVLILVLEENEYVVCG